jgi:Na+-transporting methylmalonyl-CoA/oxaloacetate decarboxylase gamma subunit
MIFLRTILAVAIVLVLLLLLLLILESLSSTSRSAGTKREGSGAMGANSVLNKQASLTSP